MGKDFNVPQLLRYLRLNYYNDGKYHDREALRNEWDDIMLAKFETYKDFRTRHASRAC